MEIIRGRFMLRSSVRFARGCMGLIYSGPGVFYFLPSRGQEMDLVIDTASDGSEQRKLVGYIRIVYKNKINRGELSWILLD